MKPQRLAASVQADPIITLIGFLKEPTNLERMLQSNGFDHVIQTPIPETGIFVDIYSPDKNRRANPLMSNPQFSFSQVPLSDWSQVTMQEVLAEGVLMVRYPLDADLTRKYISLLSEFTRSSDIIID